MTTTTASRGTLWLGASNAIEYEHPVNVLADPPEPLNTSGDGAVASFRVFDSRRQSVLSAAESAGETTLSVATPGVFSPGVTVEVALDTGGAHEATVVSVDLLLGTVEIDVALLSSAEVGRPIRVRLGAPVSMSEYGTPSTSTADWGFRGFIVADPPVYYDGQDVDVEITFVGDPGSSDLDDFKVFQMTVRKDVSSGDCC